MKEYIVNAVRTKADNRATIAIRTIYIFSVGRVGGSPEFRAFALADSGGRVTLTRGLAKPR